MKIKAQRKGGKMAKITQREILASSLAVFASKTHSVLHIDSQPGTAGPRPLAPHRHH